MHSHSAAQGPIVGPAQVGNKSLKPLVHILNSNDLRWCPLQCAIVCNQDSRFSPSISGRSSSKWTSDWTDVKNGRNKQLLWGWYHGARICRLLLATLQFFSQRFNVANHAASDVFTSRNSLCQSTIISGVARIAPTNPQKINTFHCYTLIVPFRPHLENIFLCLRPLSYWQAKIQKIFPGFTCTYLLGKRATCDRLKPIAIVYAMPVKLPSSSQVR